MELVKEHDPNFYEAILPYVDQMPDFRPKETLEKMAKRDGEGNLIIEPQRNWSLILHEIEAISYDKKGEAMIKAINEEDVDRIKRLDKLYSGLIGDFIFSYPALTWLMMKISPKKGIYYMALLGDFYTHELDLEEEDMYMIKNVEIARLFIQKLNIPMTEIHRNLMRNAMMDSIDVKWIYLFLAHPLYRGEPVYHYLAIIELIRNRCHKTIEMVLSDKQVDLSKGVNRAIPYLIKKLEEIHCSSDKIVCETLKVIERSGVILYPETVELMKNSSKWIAYNNQKNQLNYNAMLRFFK